MCSLHFHPRHSMVSQAQIWPFQQNPPRPGRTSCGALGLVASQTGHRPRRRSGTAPRREMRRNAENPHGECANVERLQFGGFVTTCRTTNIYNKAACISHFSICQIYELTYWQKFHCGEYCCCLNLDLLFGRFDGQLPLSKQCSDSKCWKSEDPQSKR